MAYARTCPRCGVNKIPSNERPGEYPGAMSRVLVDGRRIIEICSKCGEDEAMEQCFGGGLTPVAKWPVGDWMEITNQIENSVKQFQTMRDQGCI